MTGSTSFCKRQSTPRTKSNSASEKVRCFIQERQDFLFDGFAWWCAGSQPEAGRKLGIPVRTLKRIVGKDPEIQTRSPVIDGRKTYLLRVGADHKSVRDVRNIMSTMWRKELARQAAIYGSEVRRTSTEEFGMICGLIEVWPDGKAIEIFRTVLEDWGGFMARAKVHFSAAYLNDNGDPTRHYRQPTMSVLRRFAPVAPDMLISREQSKGIQAPWHLEWYAEAEAWEAKNVA